MTSFDDEEAAERAARARQLGTNIVRSHLHSHLDNNPDSSFITWISTLHPENATVTIDDRFFIPGNPWQMVYQEAIMKQSDDQVDGHSSSSSSSQPRSSAESSLPASELLRRCSPLDLLIGSALTLTLVTTVVVLEISAWIVYCLEATFSQMNDCLSPPDLTTLWLYAIVWLLFCVFAMIDSVLLLLSVLISELIAATQFALSLCFGGCSFAGMWHQSLRRTAHSIRIWFRAPCKNPKRRVFGNVNAIVDWWNADKSRHDHRGGSVAEDGQQYRALESSSSNEDDDDIDIDNDHSNTVQPTAIQTAVVYHT